MTLFAETTEIAQFHPLDAAEQALLERDLAYDRPGDEELVGELPGMWGHLRIWFTWQEPLGVLSFSAAFDARIPPALRAKVYTLLALANEQLWIGHFDIAEEDGSIAFRHGLLVRDAASASSAQLQDLLDIALQECNRFYPALQSVVWGGQDPREAMKLALFDTVGEA